jgi:16S rRNA (guanine527-N7)-methyltransferase
MNGVSRETALKLGEFRDMVIVENGRQNLVSATSLLDFDTRHIDDGAQLAALGTPGNWCDIGSGAGLPGVVIALLTGEPMTLIEPRHLRAEFLRSVVATLGLNAVVIEAKAERVDAKFDNITARAVAETSKLFGMAEHLAHHGTRFVLPKGRSAQKELDAAQQSWQGRFTLVPSRTSAEAMILVAEDVRRRGRR